MNEEARKYIEDLRENFEGECNGPSDLNRRKELLTNARHAITISNENFTKVEMEHASFVTMGSFELGFYVGARWADEHPQSSWISPSVKLPDPHEKVLVCVHKERRSSTTLSRPFEYELNFRLTEAEQSRILRRTRFSKSDLYDKYGFLKHGADVYNVLYWMHIPEKPKGGKE